MKMITLRIAGLVALTCHLCFAQQTPSAGAAAGNTLQKPQPDHPTWEEDFAKAQERATLEKKMILVTLNSAKDKYTIFISRAFEDYAREHLVLFNAVCVQPGETGFTMKDFTRQFDALYKLPVQPTKDTFGLVDSEGNSTVTLYYSSEEFQNVNKLLVLLERIREHMSVQLQWMTNLQDAKMKARKEGKCLFIVFPGKQQTFGESYFRDDWDFHNTVKAGMILVRVSQGDVIKSSLVDEFGIKEFPWVTVLSPSAEDRIVNTSGAIFLNRHNPALGGISSGEWFPGFTPATIAPFLAIVKANEFLSANRTKDGVIALPSGLQYMVLVAGTGRRPASSDVATYDYILRLLDKTECENSYRSGKPVSRPVIGPLKGLTEALQLMPCGSTWRLFIPPDLAFGKSGNGAIPPNSLVVAQVELISTAPPQAQPSPYIPSHWPGISPLGKPGAAVKDGTKNERMEDELREMNREMDEKVANAHLPEPILIIEQNRATSEQAIRDKYQRRP